MLKLECEHSRVVKSIECDGVAIAPKLFGAGEVDRMRALIDELPADDAVRKRRGAAFGVRNLLGLCPALRSVVLSNGMMQPVRQLVGERAFVTRAILFDKQPDANWAVRWHQDTTIAVREKRDVPGFGPWSEKAGVVHVRPPRNVLEGMITARIHLDACDESNGALQVVPGSHTCGLLDADAASGIRERRGSRLCSARVGEVLFMRPLILHASSAGTTPSRRRVIHLEFAAANLAGELEWNVA